MGLNFIYNKCNGKKMQHNDCWAKALKEEEATFNYKEVIDNLTHFGVTKTFFTFNEIHKFLGLLSLPMLV